MDLLHSRGPHTVILSSTELGSDDFLLGLASRITDGVKTVVRVEIPKFPAAFVGTGDLFTALCTAWLTKTEGDLKVTRPLYMLIKILSAVSPPGSVGPCRSHG